MDATHLGIIIFFAKQMEALITSLIMRMLKKYKKSHIDIYIYMKNECLHQYQRIYVLLIVQQLIQFSRIINFSLVW